MAVEIPTYGIGSVTPTATSFGADISATFASAKPTQSLFPEFAAKLSEASSSVRPANVISQLSPAKKFEAIFVAQMMTSILPEDSEYFGEGFAGDAWRSMMSEQLANVAVKQTEFGIASLIDQGMSARSAAEFSAQKQEPGSATSLIESLLDDGGQ